MPELGDIRLLYKGSTKPLNLKYDISLEEKKTFYSSATKTALFSSTNALLLELLCYISART